jgi:hypothetical protein
MRVLSRERSLKTVLVILVVVDAVVPIASLARVAQAQVGVVRVLLIELRQ